LIELAFRREPVKNYPCLSQKGLVVARKFVITHEGGLSMIYA